MIVAILKNPRGQNNSALNQCQVYIVIYMSKECMAFYNFHHKKHLNRFQCKLSPSDFHPLLSNEDILIHYIFVPCPQYIYLIYLFRVKIFNILNNQKVER